MSRFLWLLIEAHHMRQLLSFFQQHRLLAKVLLLRWPFNIASMAKYYCFVGQVSNHASQPDFPSDPKKV